MNVKKPNRINQRYRLLLYIGACLLLTACCLLPSLQNGFTNWDDSSYLLDNNIIQNWNAENLQKIWTEVIPDNYIPLTTLSFALEYQIAGLNPFTYHLNNLLLHLLNVFWVFMFVRLLTKGKNIIAFIVALGFGIHPMHVESVAWVVARKDVLYVAFMMPALIAYIHFVRQKKYTWYILSFALFVAACLAKPAAVIFPLLILLMDYWEGYSFKKVLVYIAEKTPFFLVALLFGLITLNIQKGGGIELFQYTSINKLLFASYGLVFYVGKFIVPIQQSAFYPYPDLEQGLSLIYYVSPIFISTTLVFIKICNSKCKALLFGCLFYFINLLLVIQIISIGHAVVAERYTYLSYVGLFWIVAHLAAPYLTNIKTSNEETKNKISFRGGKAVVLTGLSLYFITCAYLTFERCKIWESSETLWTDAIAKQPNAWLAYNNRGNYYRNADELKKACTDYDKALELRGDFFKGLVNRATVHLNLKQLTPALEDINKALRFQPKSHEALNSRGGIYFQQKQYTKALIDMNKVIELAPDYTRAYLNRGNLYSATKRYDKALEDYNVFLEKNPNNAYIRYYRGNVFLKQKAYQRAIADFNRAIARNPDIADFWKWRSVAYEALGNPAQAESDRVQAEELRRKEKKFMIDSPKQ